MKKRVPILLSLVLPVYLFGVTDFELINHNSKEVSGNGVYVGVIDSAINNQHPNLAGKIEDQIYSTYGGKTYTPDFSVDTHGSHVAGIIVATKDESEKVECVVTGAKIYGVQITGYNTTGAGTFIYPDIYKYYKEKDVKVINNSWNTAMYPLSGLYEFLGSMTTTNESFLQDPYTAKTYLDMIKQNSSVATDLMKLSKEKNTLSVFAAGNEGIISPGLMGLIPYYDESMRSFITVGALDSSKITKNDKGQFVISLEGATIYSNGLKGAYNFGLVAPGTDITNVNAAYNAVDPLGKVDKNKYRTSSGTSQATPMVTGAAALVAEKFPFMNGKQIADVLLSTANRDYIVPKVVVKQTDTKTSIYGKRFTVFYVDSEIPRNADGSIDYDEVEMDVIRAEYYSYYPDLSLEALEGIGKDYAAVQEIKKEDLFGQGILDIDKALKGLGILDANRLSDNDVKNIEGEQTAVYYSLDTQGNDAEFSNDISQRKWEASTHNSKADNLPTQLDNLNVGLIKTGLGTLTLSGTNTYEGATVINEGGLNLKRIGDKGGEIAGNVYVNNGSTLSGNGVIKKDLTNNNSTVRPGNADLTDLTVEGTYTQKDTDSKLILDFGDSDNSQLIAKSYNIETGTLEYNPLQNYYTAGKEITIKLGGLADSLDKFSNVLVASNQSINFEIKLDADKTTINKDPNSNPVQPSAGNQGDGNGQSGTTTPSTPTIGETSTDSGTTSGDGSNGGVNSDSSSEAQSGQNGTGSFNGSSSAPDSTGSSGSSSSAQNPQTGGNSQSNPSSGSQTGGNTQGTQNGSGSTQPAQPTQPSQDSSQSSNNGNSNSNAPANPSQNQNNGSSSSNSNAQNNQNQQTGSNSQNQAPSQTDDNNQNNNAQETPNNNSVIIVTPVVKSDAYASNSAQLSQTMRDIRGRSDLNPQYQQFFATLDSSSQESYKSTMNRIEGRSIGDMTSIQSSTHKNFMQNNMLFSLSPATSTLFAYNQNPYDSGVLVASVASDYIIDLGLNRTAPKDYWYINPTFKRYNGDGFDGYQSGASVNLAQHIGESGLIAYGVGASVSKLDFDIGTTAKSSNFDIAVNYTHDFESFKLISGGSFMVSFNDNERTVATTLNSDYKSYSSSLQLGVAKDFRHYSIVVTPLGYVGYGKIYQESFKESGGLFAKNYDSINHDIYTAGVGLNLAYEASDERSRYTGYAIYERMIEGYEMDATAEFNDFKGQKFSQRYHLDKNRLNLGVGAEYAFDSGYFAKFGVGGEFATTSDNFNLSATFGKRF